ncbi:hypothetical protein GCM10014715_68060 [Streptomyces spiralis]|uniref:Insertion element IS402-like domain-containing protein n=1 Tax=Streptomyces spiralis TaxID=66376 RepID=A0A919AFV1_9ACTN|nr:hypothetical protein GCM10014715_68060 [Streptomyces spiralis]
MGGGHVTAGPATRSFFRERTGIPWRDLPERSGRCKTVHERHRRWPADGTWDRIPRAVPADADAEGRIEGSMAGVDPTSCRAHRHSAGAHSKTPRIPEKEPRPSSIAPPRDSEGPPAA